MRVSPLLCGRIWLTTLVASFLAAGTAGTQSGAPQGSKTKPWADAVGKRVGAELSHLDALYKHLHANPELSYQEVKTAARLAAELRELGFAVTEKVGGHGIVGVFKNGKGPVVLVRTDMDALPVTEQTGLPYASKVRARDRYGNEVGVMHACGHDMHMT